MRIAYLVNQYPLPSQTFIRREIAALEADGIPVTRYSVRASEGHLADSADRSERQRTRAVLDVGPFGLFKATLRELITNPVRFARSLITAIRLGIHSSRGLVIGLVYFAEACVLVGWLRHEEISHVHVHFGTNATTVALLCTRLGGPPYSFTAHGPEEFDRPEGLNLGAKVSNAEFVAAISDFCRSQLYRWSPHEHWSKIHIVRCGLDDSFLGGELVPVPDVPRLVSVGRLSEQKGQLLLIEAVGRLLDEGCDVELVLVGDGPMRREVESHVSSLPQPGAVRLLGLLDNESVRLEMLAARATVLPSFAEGLPVVLMESLALARPVVTTFIAGVPELVTEGACGWLVPAGSVDDLVVAMRSALDTPTDVLTQMGREGARRVRARHDVTTEAGKLAALLRAHDRTGTSER